jgi:Leucine-rich repeat (LRR) protein
VGTNNGTLQGGATASASGLIGSAFSFDGTNSFVQIPDSPVFHPTNLTIEVWVRFSGLDSQSFGGSPAGDQYIVFKESSSICNNFEGFDLSKTRIGGNDVFRFLVASASGQEIELDSITPLTTNIWYHVAGVRGSNFTQIYFNGQLQGQTNVNFPQDYANLPIYFGSSGEACWDHKLRGALDEVTLYNRALASNEIAAIYAAGAAGKCKGINITTPPTGQTVVLGSNASFTVSATGLTPLSYQWQFNGTNISGATATTLTLNNVQPTNAGNYTVAVTNKLSAVTSGVAALTVLVPPGLTTSPQSLTVVQGQNAPFSAAATGSGQLSYQWVFNGSPISGATGSNYTRVSAQSGDAGSYWVVVTNVAGSATSVVATLTVNVPPTISGPPQGLTVNQGHNATFTVSATGTAPLGYQWRFGAVNIAGATASNYTRVSAQPADVGNYDVVVTNVAGATTSVVATLTVNVSPTISGPPQSLTVNQGQNATFTVLATGTAPLSYQWRFGAVNIAGATGSNYTRVSAQPADAGNYSVVLTNVAGSVTSAVATLTVTSGPPVFISQPASQTWVVGRGCGSVLFGASASGNPPPNYQWLHNGISVVNDSHIDGATTTTLAITSPQAADVGSYALVATNTAGVATSAVANLSNTVPLIRDINLEAAVRSALAKPTGDLAGADLLALTNLFAGNAHVSDLTGLQNAINLRSLYLGGNLVQDVTPLHNLTQLRSLFLHNNLLTDLSPLAGLTDLSYLELRSNPITNHAAVLPGITSLTNLFLGGNSISNLTFLQGLSQLTFLDLDNNSVGDLSALAALPNLKGLDLSYNPFANFSQLGTFTALTNLYLSGNSISNLTFLQNLGQLSSLSLCNDTITNISKLAGLTKLTSLNLGGNLITNFAGLSGWTNLSSLWLYGNSLTNLPSFQGLGRLSNLALNDNGIVDASPLATLTNLALLNLENNRITNCSSLAGLTKLTALGLGGNSIASGTCLQGLARLASLSLNNNLITDISPLAGLPNLASLNLGANLIGDYTSLSGLSNLASLWLYGNSLSSPGFLTNMSGITFLDLSSNQISNLAPLAGLTNLTSLHLSANPISNWAMVSGLTNLSSLYLKANSISNLSFIPPLTRLSTLHLEKNLLTDLSTIAGLTNLNYLFASHNRLANLAGIQCLPRLYYVDLRTNLLDLSVGSPPLHVIQNLTNRLVTVDFLPQNQPPNILSTNFLALPAYLAMPVNGTFQLNFTVSDDETPANQLQVMASSQNPALMPSPGILGSSTNRTLVLAPGFNQTGTATITLNATDDAALSTNVSLVIAVIVPQPVTIPDPNLETAIRSVLNKPTGGLSNVDLLTLTSLVVNHASISNLSGLEWATNLAGLSLTGGSISNLTVLQHLSQLTHLTLRTNSITDISPLTSLTNLSYLDLGVNPIASFSPFLNGFTNLTTLILDGTSCSNLTVLQNLKQLTSLILDNNQISDLSPLATLTNLDFLSLSQNRLTDISTLANLVNLDNVDISYNLLDLNAGSPATALIQTLLDRGVFVSSWPQREPPTISIRALWLINTNVTSVLTFEILDNGPVTAPLFVRASSSITNLVPSASLRTNQNVDGSWGLSVTPAPNQTGATTITLAVTDDVGFSASTSILVTVTPFPAFNGQLLNTTNLTLTTGGNAPWFGQTLITHDGISAAQSGQITDLQESWLETTVPGSGLLTFWWKVSSEENYDFLKFYVNGVLQSNAISGEVDWQQQSFLLPVGTQTLRWRYAKDKDTSMGLDAGWLGDVAFVSLSWLEVAGPPTNGQFLLILHGTVAKSYTIQWSPDLLNWYSLGILTLTNSSTPFLDPAVDAKKRFYRLLESPEGQSYLENPSRLGSNIQFALQSAPNLRFEIQASTNLTSWTSLALITNTIGMAQYTTPMLVNSFQCFYRAKLVQ